MAYHFNNRIEFVAEEDGGFMPGTGGEVVKAKAWADIRTMKGSELVLHENSSVLVGKSRFIIRHRTDIKIDWDIKHNGKKYVIESIVNDDERNQTITIIANAVLEN